MAEKRSDKKFDEEATLRLREAEEPWNLKKALAAIESGADPNILFRAKMTMLHYAVSKNEIELAKALLEAGATNCKNTSGKTPLNFAEMGLERDEEGYREIHDLLKKHYDKT
ncbi:ankyrin repeat domain-containing protein [Candidatus Pacearchaeota archaeon]|nr:ankyrin repeat domain-containing protein [Candidatus Pacearchaeota archaeon]